MTAPTAQQSRAALGVVLAVSEAIRDLGRIPSGHLYAQLAGRMDLPTYERIIGALVSADLVRKANHELIWIGPSR